MSGYREAARDAELVYQAYSVIDACHYIAGHLAEHALGQPEPML
jgi:hypothetical protein